MDAPPIQYARTDDGVNIAYRTLGDGARLCLRWRRVPARGAVAYGLYDHGEITDLNANTFHRPQNVHS